ncbi:PD-(D/E)XK nuclease family protein [Ramlibacter albus]|uniref:PD-(D/E)XK nuclease family protein n=1 Tax=Ramlibacter albus TaxID=2079448 RepID=A0A923MAD4_9BURK|nr:PD-(D/E)XK nuclease family protein [Ramlibacter albus]MBC5766606.1 PD-(D/E)XK nuclease family protein [Ramlibacter albus]
MDAIAQTHQRLALLIADRRAHAARTVVVLPFAQLIAVARREWSRVRPTGFAPRFETLRNWAGAGAFEPGELDFAFDRGRDLLTARSLLGSAGLEARAEALAPMLVDTAQQLAGLAAAVLPGRRAAWAAQARAAVLQDLAGQPLQLEAAVAHVAIEWVAASAYETDALLAPGALDEVDLLVVLQGVQPEPLLETLLDVAGDKGVAWPLAVAAPRGRVALHPARDAAEEAERAAACVLRHVAEGRVPVALAATDRVLTRRIAALLAPAGLRMRDEQGWKLSTTRSAASVMALLRSAAWDAATDDVLDWLKHAPAVAPGTVLGLERRVRRAGVREWRSLREDDCGESAALRELLVRVSGWRESMSSGRPLAQWLSALREVLQATGQLAKLRIDDAGMQVLDALRLGAAAEDDLARLSQAGRRLSAGEFRSWVDEVLEAESFRPPAAPDAQVVVLPFTQTLGRPFAALVLPGCDERRLPASPDPAGAWTPQQRRALGLPSREKIEAAQRAAWEQALQVPHVDVLWRQSDERGEPLLASPLVQLLRLEGAEDAGDARELRNVDPAPVARPQPQATVLPVDTISASAYEDLRRCPYRFFAIRQLGLKEAEELDTEVDKRDFGNWVHKVLRRFHEQLRDAGEPADGRAALLDRVAADELSRLRVEEGEFLPFQAGWPGVRDAYLAWLAKHEAKGARFVEAESEHRVALGDVALFGYIDRIDALPQGRLVIDYKTEGETATKDRMKDPIEDTQLAFYAALLDADDLSAAYLNVGERGRITEVAHPSIAGARELLREGIATELARIASGAALPALGEGAACEFCGARGLCRKDSWS